MTTLHLAEAQLIAFVMVDAAGDEVTGLGTSFTVEISKNGGVFAAGAGTKAEIGSGWYSYTLTASETDTEGPLAVTITGAGAIQQNLLYQVSGSVWEAPSGTNVLTAAEGAAVLRCAEDDPNLLMLLPQIDDYLEGATGHDWASDATICPKAKSAARMLLVRWHEDPGGMAAGASLGFGLNAALTQLEALALRYRTFEGLPNSGYIYLPGIYEGDSVESVTGVQGASGDQSANFETVISENNFLRQISLSDLEDQFFRALIVPKEAL